MKKKKTIANVILIFILIMLPTYVFNIYLKLEKFFYREEYSKISEEKFDEYGNITHYKHSQRYKGCKDEFTSIYDFSYVYDENQRLTKVLYESGNYIEIEYDEVNRISKLTNYYGKKYEYNFKYENDKIIILESHITNLVTTDGAKTPDILINNKSILKTVTYKGKDYVVYADIKNDKPEIYLICEKREEDINYSNLKSILNITYPDYENNDNIFHNNFYDNIIPIFNAGKVVYADYAGTYDHLLDEKEEKELLDYIKTLYIY